MSALHVKQVVPFFYVSNIEASVRYYESLGFEMINTWVVEGALRWCWLKIGEAALMLQEFAPGAEKAASAERKLGDGVSLNFICDDALAFYREVNGKGVVAKRPFVGNGMWVVTLADPDGYQIHFESVTDAPEESELPLP